MQLSVQTLISRPRRAVFAAFCDLERAPRRMRRVSRVELLTPGRFDVGTRWLETRRILGAETTGEFWVTRHRPGEMYRIEGEARGTHLVGDVEFSDVREGVTRVSMTFTRRPLTHAARLTAIAAPLLTMGFRTALQRDLEDMRMSLEGDRCHVDAANPRGTWQA